MKGNTGGEELSQGFEESWGLHYVKSGFSVRSFLDGTPRGRWLGVQRDIITSLGGDVGLFFPCYVLTEGGQ